MLTMYLVTLNIKDLTLPVGYFSRSEAEKIKKETLETYRKNDFHVSVLIAPYRKSANDPVFFDRYPNQADLIG